LLKCGHFFCKFCLENNYTDEEGKVYCPEDGCIAQNISELRLLNNLIIDKNRDGSNEKIEDVKKIFIQIKLIFCIKTISYFNKYITNRTAVKNIQAKNYLISSKKRKKLYASTARLINSKRILA
jgi:hypothetical protein